MADITQDRLRELLRYDLLTGIFTLRVSRGGLKAGTVAGSLDSLTGRVKISICGKMYKAHRLAFLYVLGDFPPNGVDHRDGNAANNRWVNLRHATQAQNSQNQKLRINNKTGFQGVGYYKQYGKYRARIGINGKDHCIGYYETAEEAYAARCKAKRDLHTFQPEVRPYARST